MAVRPGVSLWAAVLITTVVLTAMQVITRILSLKRGTERFGVNTETPISKEGHQRRRVYPLHPLALLPWFDQASGPLGHWTQQNGQGQHALEGKGLPLASSTAHTHLMAEGLPKLLPKKLGHWELSSLLRHIGRAIKIIRGNQYKLHNLPGFMSSFTHFLTRSLMKDYSQGTGPC